MNLTACIIAKDECNWKFKRCLESIKDLCSEIIVIVDTGETGLSKAIALEYTQNVYYYQWIDNFADKRNISFKHSTGDYNLVIDDDEWIEKSEHEKIKKALGSHDVYILRQDNIIKDNQHLIVRHNRIIKNNGKILYHNRSHEDINKAGFTELDLDVVIMHDGYLMTEQEAKIKVQRNIELHIKQIEDEPYNPMTFFYLARCYMQIKEYDLAGSFACLALITRDLPNDHKSQLCILLHDVWLSKNNPFLAVQYMARAIDLVPKQRRGRWGMANFYEASGKYNEAIRELEYILSLNNIDTDLTGDLIINEEQILNNIQIIKKEIENASV